MYFRIFRTYLTPGRYEVLLAVNMGSYCARTGYSEWLGLPISFLSIGLNGLVVVLSLIVLLQQTIIYYLAPDGWRSFEVFSGLAAHLGHN